MSIPDQILALEKLAKIDAKLRELQDQHAVERSTLDGLKSGLARLDEKLGSDLRVFGPPAGDDRGGVISLAVRDVHPHDLAQVLDQFAVCVRPGHHCAKPLMRHLGVNATARASLYVYNGTDDVDALVEAIAEAGTLFG